jgi:hypothetical protein
MLPIGREKRMAKIMFTVCDECGARTLSSDRWLKLASIDVRYNKTDEEVFTSAQDLDFCSPGCLTRYLLKSLEPALMGNALPNAEPVDPETKPAPDGSSPTEQSRIKVA